MKPRSILALLLISAVVFLASGCAAKPKRVTLNVIPKTQASVEVDIVGASELELLDWKSYSISKYFQAGDAMRRGADKITVRVIDGRAEPPTVGLDDEAWGRWFARGSRYLIILANLPGDHQDGPADPRRKVIDLTKEFKNNGIETQIQDSRIVIMTPQKQ